MSSDATEDERAAPQSARGSLPPLFPLVLQVSPVDPTSNEQDDFFYDPFANLEGGDFAAAHAFFIHHGRVVGFHDCPDAMAFQEFYPTATIGYISSLPRGLLEEGYELLAVQRAQFFRGRLDHEQAFFVYTGQEDDDVLEGVTHIKLHLSAKVIKKRAFYRHWHLTTVHLCDGLEEIGEWAFRECQMLRGITIPDSVRTIKDEAFKGCPELTSVRLGDGLVEIGRGAFRECRSVQRIVVPHAVRAIKHHTFSGCSGLTTVILNDSLEEIGCRAFHNCASLRRIVIPSAVTTIYDEAFGGCSNLIEVRFCDEIEEFVSGESMRDWWNHGVHDMCSSSYCFLVRCDIPRRLGLVRVRMWRTNIHGMLQLIPFIYRGGIHRHLDSIDAMLTKYENLKDAPTLLELAIWKSEITKQFGPNKDALATEMKMKCRIDSLSMGVFIIRNVLVFL